MKKMCLTLPLVMSLVACALSGCTDGPRDTIDMEENAEIDDVNAEMKTMKTTKTK